jgi:hypothetical protein
MATALPPASPAQLREDFPDISDIAHLAFDGRHVERIGGGLERIEEKRPTVLLRVGIDQHGATPQAGRNLLEQLETFAADRRLGIGDPSHIPVGSCH